MGQTDSKPNSNQSSSHNSSHNSDDLSEILAPPSSSSSSSLVYQNIPYTSYSYEKLPSKQEIIQQQQSSQSSQQQQTSSQLPNQPLQQQSQQSIQNKLLLNNNNNTSKDEIITINKLENAQEKELELEKLSNIPHFFPLLNDSDESWITPNGNPLSVSDMDNRGALNISIDIQNYLKNSTGYIIEKQVDIMHRVRDVENKQSKKLVHVMSTRVSETTHYQFGFKEVCDKVKNNITKSKALVYKIGDLIEQLESVLPENERENFKKEIHLMLPPTQQTSES